MSLAAGTRFGPYEIVDALGAGAMGEVYRARDTKLGREVAIKLLPSALAADPDRLARFAREARVLASLNHQHIATIHGVEDTESGPALVMELVEGPTLAEKLAQDSWRKAPAGVLVADALAIGRQIAEALEAAHEKGVIHRDLKPADGKELFFIAGDDRLTATPIQFAPDNGIAVPGTPQALFATNVGSAAALAFRQQYVVARDGQSFIMNSAVEIPAPRRSPSS